MKTEKTNVMEGCIVNDIHVKVNGTYIGKIEQCICSPMIFSKRRKSGKRNNIVKSDIVNIATIIRARCLAMMKT